MPVIDGSVIYLSLQIIIGFHAIVSSSPI